jgi:hypothetical protein
LPPSDKLTGEKTMKTGNLVTFCLSAALLAGCVEESSMVAGSDVPISDVDACEAAVMRETGNAQVRTLRTEFSEANNAVIVGVGPNAAPWQCLISGGVVAGVMSMTNEGSL